ncbi:hypothetical protein LINPERPRIM_LOCUS10185 [Linum perenne]
MMPETSPVSTKDSRHTDRQRNTREDSEFVRLVMSNESMQISQSTSRFKSPLWWGKILSLSLVAGVVIFISFKWVLPFLFEKVLYPMMKWEATAFGRPVLALVLVASLALFPVFLIPSGPSMWLAGMIFGYGIGFVIIIAGTTIGMILPYFIGLLFRERIHTCCGRYLVPPVPSGRPLQGITVSLHDIQLRHCCNKFKILALHLWLGCRNGARSFPLYLQVRFFCSSSH